MTVNNSDTIVRKGDFLAATVGDEAVLLDVDRGAYVGFNAVASDIWRRLESPVEVQALCEALAADFAGEPATIEHDVLAFLSRLLDQGLVRIVR